MTRKACKGVVTTLSLGRLGLKRNAFGRIYVVAESVSWAYGACISMSICIRLPIKYYCLLNALKQQTGVFILPINRMISYTPRPK